MKYEDWSGLLICVSNIIHKTVNIPQEYILLCTNVRQNKRF